MNRTEALAEILAQHRKHLTLDQQSYDAPAGKLLEELHDEVKDFYGVVADQLGDHRGKKPGRKEPITNEDLKDLRPELLALAGLLMAVLVDDLTGDAVEGEDAAGSITLIAGDIPVNTIMFSEPQAPTSAQLAHQIGAAMQGRRRA